MLAYELMGEKKINTWAELAGIIAKEMLEWPEESRRLFLAILNGCYCRRCGASQIDGDCTCTRKD